MQNFELAQHLACIEDHLIRWGWDSWDFELTDTTHLFAPWSNPPIPQAKPNDRVIARYILKNRARRPLVFCLAEIEAENLVEIQAEEDFHKTLASYHATLQQLPVAMYTHRGWVWDYVNIAAGEDWHTDDPHLSAPLDPVFIDELAKREFLRKGERITMHT